MRVYFFCILGLALVGCAQRLDEIDERVVDLEKRAAALEVKTGSPIGSDRELLQGQKLADVRSQVAALRNELTVMIGRVEALEFESKRLNTRTDAIDQDLGELSRSLKKPTSNTTPEGGVASPAEPEPSDYDKALKLHQDGEFQKAEKMFLSFVSKNPRNPLSDNALFWVGDGFMNQKMYKQAIASFQDLIDRYPKSDKKCDAISKQIQALKELGMQKEAGLFAKMQQAECK